MNLYTQNFNLAQASVASKKRLVELRRDRFYPNLASQSAPFDDKVRDVVLSYALRPDEVLKANHHLDAIGYGAIRCPESHWDALARFSAPHKPNRAWMRGFRRAKAKLIDVLRHDCGTDLTPMMFANDEQIMEALPKADSHCGWPYLHTGIKHKGDYEGEAFRLWCESLETVKTSGSHGLPVLPAYRLQCSGGYEDGQPTDKVKHKERLVGMYPFQGVISEMVFSIPFQRAMSQSSIYIGSRDPGELSKLILNRRGLSSSWVSLDYSKYDQSIPGWLIREAFDCIESCFNPIAFDSVRWLWRAVVYDFIHAPIVGPTSLVERCDGVPSGSMFTQLIDTLCNYLMIQTWAESFGETRGRPLKFNMMICGDDNLIFINENGLSPYHLEEEMLSYIGHVFGVQGSSDKLGSGDSTFDDPHFLSRDWRYSGTWREWHELFAHMCYPERRREYRWNPDLSPAMIVWSYILAYPAGMKDWINIEAFLRDYRYQIPTWSEAALSDAVPGYLKFQRQYIDRKIADFSINAYRGVTPRGDPVRAS